jgi:cell division protein FtsQ
MKKWISTIVLILLAGYIVFAAIAFSSKPSGQVCKGVKLEIVDSAEVSYLTTADVLALLRRSNLDPTGKPMEEIRLRSLERALSASPLIRTSECYKTIGGHVAVSVECHKPILHIIADSGDNFYLDEEGEVIEHIAKAVYVPLAMGNISRKFAREGLLPLAQYLQDEELWNAQIEHIYVNDNGEIELIPRVGDHIIVLGSPKDYADKFDNLLAFYKKALSEVGWDRYSHINLDNEGQVVATKRNTTKH